MSSDIIIRVKGLSKRYTLNHKGNSDGVRHAVHDFVTAPFRRFRRNGAVLEKVNQDSVEDFWALKDVSFELKRGEVVGIIGRNGAGKSTLLKVLSRITEPTAGRIEIDGRVASLLEVGTGFHPELTGRENVYLNGAILGMPQAEVRRRFDEIIEFAEVERFLDTPVKRYSSGMYVRLAFAVAAHLEPEVLVVDEVLAVGDAAFQAKCLGKMSGVAKSGRTILFVSHNTPAVRALCGRAIFLQGGQIARDGLVDEVLDHYLAGGGQHDARMAREWTNNDLPPNEILQVNRITVTCNGEDVPAAVKIDEAFQITIAYRILTPGVRIILNLGFYTREGTVAFVSLTTNDPIWHGRPFPCGEYRSTCTVPANLLNAGEYQLRILFIDDQAKHVFDLPNALILRAEEGEVRPLAYYKKWAGVVRPELRWITES